MNIRYRDEVYDEINASVAWYAEHNPVVAEAFRSRLAATLQSLAEAPLSFQRWGKTACRRAPVRGFPFVIVYVPTESGVLVLAVAHARRDPAYWRDRM